MDAKALKKQADKYQSARGSEGDSSLLLRRADEAPDPKALQQLERELTRGTQLSDLKRVKTLRPLTPGQQTFLDRVVGGDTYIHAYKVAFPNQKGSAKTLADSAYKLGNHPVIVAAMDRAALERQRTVRVSASAIHEHVIERLLHESQHAESDSARVRALELLGKLTEVAAFTDRKEVTTVTLKPDELKQALMSKLKQFFSDNRQLTASDPALPRLDAPADAEPDA